jgi:outer membrane cobalamin receptor
MRFFILTIFLFVLRLDSAACHAQLNGIYILDAQTKTPIWGAEIRDTNENTLEITNELGFVAGDFASGNRLFITALGYARKEITYTEGSFVYLQAAATELAEVQITAKNERADLKKLAQLDLHLRPLQSAQDVLRVVPGLFIGQHAGGGKAEQIFLRGFDIDHGTDIRISADDIPVNLVSHAHGQGYADLHFVIPELIEQVDFNKGPYFADKGNFTTAGYVDLRIKRILDQSFVKVEGGQFETGRVVAAINLLPATIRAVNQSLYAALEATGTQGFFDAPQDFRRINALLKYHGKASENTILHASVSSFSSKWNASGQIPERAVADGTIGYFGAIDATEGGNTSRINAQMEMTTSLRNGDIFKQQVYYSKSDFELYSNFTFFKENPTDGDQIRQREQRQLFGYTNRYERKNEVLGIAGKMEMGIQSRTDLVQDVELSRTKQRNITLLPLQKGDVREMNHAAYNAGISIRGYKSPLV